MSSLYGFPQLDGAGRMRQARIGDRNYWFRKNVLGVYAETFPFAAQATSVPVTTGRQIGVGIYLLKGDVVTNIVACVQTAGASLTRVELGLYSYSPNTTLLVSTGDVKAAWTGTGRISNPVTAPYEVAADGLYFVGYIATNSAGSQPVLVMSATGNTNAYSDLILQQTSQASLQNPAIWVTGLGQYPWFGVS